MCRRRAHQMISLTRGRLVPRGCVEAVYEAALDSLRAQGMIVKHVWLMPRHLRRCPKASHVCASFHWTIFCLHVSPHCTVSDCNSSIQLHNFRAGTCDHNYFAPSFARDASKLKL
mmetsp:Transcript_104181/g.206946  ORF Transcript_104181/g.206946 Transcript_104181/m.206946 type:complete len:115 (+) Transcript_104181:52-396(+)